MGSSQKNIDMSFQFAIIPPEKIGIPSSLVEPALEE